MTDNIQPIRSDIKIKKEKLKPNPKIVSKLKEILKKAEEGRVIEFSYVLSQVEVDGELDYGVLGKSDNWSLSYTLLQELVSEYYQDVVCPELGEDEE